MHVGSEKARRFEELGIAQEKMESLLEVSSIGRFQAHYKKKDVRKNARMGFSAHIAFDYFFLEPITKSTRWP